MGDVPHMASWEKTTINIHKPRGTFHELKPWLRSGYSLHLAPWKQIYKWILGVSRGWSTWESARESFDFDFENTLW